MPRTPQPLHIFRKDVMHLWPETLVVLLLYIGIAWTAPSHLSFGRDNLQAAIFVGILSVVLKLLVVIAWLVVISRLIQDESLVGDRQFWTSRPYHWFQLFLAKLLYLVVFLYLPFLLMQIFLLKHAGLYPTTVLADLLHNLVLLSVFIVIPIAAISAVTSTFARALLSFIGAVIYLLILAGFVIWAVFRRMPPPALEPVVTWLFILFPIVALLIQYATRRTVIARSILIATPAVITILFFLVPGDLLIRQAYPAASTPRLAPIPAMFAPRQPEAGRLLILGGKVPVTIPFTLADAAKDTNYEVEGTSVTLDAPGIHWSTPFQTETSHAEINPERPINTITASIPLDILTRIGHSPADVHLVLAVQRMRTDTPSNWKATKEPFSVPGHGVCSYSTENPEAQPTCRYPFKTPPLNFVRANLSTACSDLSAHKIVGFASMASSPALLDFDPVVTEPLRLSAMNGGPAGGGLQLCPGSDLTFIQGHAEAKNRLEFELKDFILENYAAHVQTQNPHAVPRSEDQE